MHFLVHSPWVQRIAFSLGGFLLGYLVERLVVERVHEFAVSSRIKWDDLLVGSIRGLPTIWLGASGVYFAIAVGEVPPLVVLSVNRIIMIAVVGSIVVCGMRLAGGAVETLSTRTPGTMRSPTLVVNLARGVVLVLGFFIVLQNLGINITPLITALGIGGLAVALALQDTLGNLFAGVHIILARQVRPQDYIQLSSGEAGWVTDVKGRNTTIQTFPDGNLVAVPNSVLASSIVKNFSLPREAMWVSLDVGVSYDSDLDEVERITLEVAEDVLEEVDGGITNEKPVVVFHAFGDSSINFTVRMLVRDFRSQGPIRHAFIKRLHRRYNAEGIVIPFPIRTVLMRTLPDG